MVGSSMSIAGPNTVLNTIVADVLSDMADELEKSDDFDLAVHDLIKRTVIDHQRIVFNGNGYADSWVVEAEKRGLPNIKSMVEAVPSLITDKSIKLFEKHHVYSEIELRSRAEIEYEAYSKAINIEAKTMIEMSNKLYIPSVIRYITSLAGSINAIKSAVPNADVSVQEGLLMQTSTLLVEAKAALSSIQSYVIEAASKEEGEEQAHYFKEVVFPAMSKLRTPIDELELLVDKEVWPVPTYGDLLFEV